MRVTIKNGGQDLKVKKGVEDGAVIAKEKAEEGRGRRGASRGRDNISNGKGHKVKVRLAAATDEPRGGRGACRLRSARPRRGQEEAGTGRGDRSARSSSGSGSLQPFKRRRPFLYMAIMGHRLVPLPTIA